MRRFIQISVSLLLFSSIANAQFKDSYSSSSLLSKGLWFKIAITADGVYRIDYTRLKQLGLADPSNPRIFGNNSGQLSYYNDEVKPDDLKELSIQTITGSDGIFNEGDYLLFYGKGTGRWIYNQPANEYNYLHHNYSDTSFYFITSGSEPGKTVQSLPEPLQPFTYSSSESDAFFVYEHDDENLIKSGREWFQQISSVHIDPAITDLITAEGIKYRIRVAARASVQTQFRIYEGSILRKSIAVQGTDLFDFNGRYASITDSSGLIPITTSSPVFDIKFFNNGENGAHGWLDRFIFQGRKTNIFSGTTAIYTDSRSVIIGGITQFSIRSPSASPVIWDVTDPLKARQVQSFRSSDNLIFKVATDSLRTFIAFTPANAPSPLIKSSSIPAQNLHTSGPADLIIITHPLFRSYANKLAEMHLTYDGLITQIVIPSEIYNEFSGGITDIVAIRNFLRMKYLRQKGSIHPLKYVLLFGDGSYENRTPPPGNPNYIPTYQSENSNDVVASFTSDDFYGLLDDGEGEADGTLDIGIGRFPVSDTIQAGILLSKIAGYINHANTGDWKNMIALTADDEDGNTHMNDAEGLSAILRDSASVYNVEKIYLDAFSQNTSANGQTYPGVNKAITDRINSGCLIFNYTGHGNENGLAAENIVSYLDIGSWKNGSKLPLFITATCEFSRFDNIDLNVATRQMAEKQSAGEMVLLNKNGGAIALMSTTRVAYSAPNYDLNRNIFNCVFNREITGDPFTFGEIIRRGKNNSGWGPNKRNFTLLGDPALKIAYPHYGKVVTDSVNGVSINEKIDSLKALSIVTIKGHIENNSGNKLNDFNGVVSHLVYDKSVKVKTLANDGGQEISFSIQNNILSSGKTKAQNGSFTFTFIVPRDIDYTFGEGKISYYAYDEKRDMNGSFNEITIGGFSVTPDQDTEGPEIELYLNDTLFRNGGISNSNPTLLAVISDKNGINISGTGIGHDLTGYLDNEAGNSFVLNTYFQNDFNNYRKGRLSYNLTELSEGVHTLTIKAWDNYNNSSEKTISFEVLKGEKLILSKLMNYPNPFSNGTNIVFEHNKPGNELDITVNIYSMDGRKIKIIRTKIESDGYIIPSLYWDGNIEGGRRAGKGIYPYTVTITTSNGEKSMISGRMIIL